MLRPVKNLNKYSGLYLPATFSRSTVGSSLAAFGAQQTTIQSSPPFSAALHDLQRDLDSEAVVAEPLAAVEVPPHERLLSHEARLLLHQGVEDVLGARTRRLNLAELSSDND